MKLHRRVFLKQLGLGAAGLGLVSSWPAPAVAAAARLARATPEGQGVSSAGVLAFLEAVAKSRHEFHSFILLRRGRVIAEGWWPPYRAGGQPHALFVEQKFHLHRRRFCRDRGQAQSG